MQEKKICEPVPIGGRKRDPRQKIAVSVRIKVGSEWADATILNVSARGAMMRTSRAPNAGSYVEIRRGADVTIIARAIWHDGRHVGLRTQDNIDVSALMRPPVQRRTTGSGEQEDRRAASRGAATAIRNTEAASRHQGIFMQYAAVACGVATGACIAA